MAYSLLATKLYIPEPRPSFVGRERLLERLDEGFTNGCRLGLICAPAGYGKSVLASQWVHRLDAENEDVLVGWLALDESDNDIVRFFSYLAAAVGISQTSAARIHQALAVPKLPQLEVLVSCLVEDVHRQIVLVLEDYHRIRLPIIHEAVQLLMDYRPSQIQILLTTREDPPFTLAKMRAQGELVEIRAQDLRFTTIEADLFFNQGMGLGLNSNCINVLAKRTEGWATGLQLAAISMQGREDVEGYLNSFRGSHRYVTEYLMDEVLNLQPSEIREFLRQTAVLKRFNAELCSAVTGRSDSETTLASLEQSNLFLIPLDNNHNWYRYHHMFADFLRTELSKEQETQILKKASAWFELHHLFGDAVECARATGDFEFTADKVEQALINPVTWSSGHISMLEGWLKTLPGAALRSRPRLQIRASRALFLAGKLQQSADNLRQAKSAVLSTDSDVLCQIDIYQAAIEAMEGSILNAKELISRASSSINEAECHVRARYFDTVGLICEQAGELQNAEAAYLKASDAALSAGVLYLAMNALCEVALVRIAQGQLSKASWACQEALDLVKDKKQLPPAAGLAWAVWGEIMRQRGDLDTAEEYILKGIKLSRQGGIIDDLRHGLILLFQLRISQNQRLAAQEALHQAELVLQGYGLPRLGNIAKAMRARYDLKFGEYTDATTSVVNSKAEYVSDYEDLTRMRLKISQRLSNALEEIDVLIDQARSGLRRLTLIEALILRTLLLHKSGCLAPAATSLGEALSLAEHEQCSQVFIDEGPALQQIIMECRNRGEFSDSSFSKELLIPPSQKEQRNARDIEAMVEELTEQEQRILELLSAGMSNQDIAGELVISLGTVKWHLHNIYGKLGVSSRTQATAKGNQLGLL